MLFTLILISSINLSSCSGVMTSNLIGKFFQQKEYTALLYSDALDSIKFKPVNRLKGVSVKEIKAGILKLSSDDIRQLNITGNYYCSVKNEEMFRLWNLYYETVSKEMWKTHCKVYILIMDLDGVLSGS